jgi:anti-sigma regulatory factor (Ser/Thr protein kinase)
MLAEATAAETRSFIATQDQLSEMDSWIEDVGVRWGVAEDVVFRARVCVAEVAANLLEHGRAQADWDEISVTLRPSGRTLAFEISDTGRAFDPTGLAAGAAEAPGSEAPGGRGLRLLRAYAASMMYRREGGRNILSLRVAPASRSALQKPAD